MSAAVAAGPPSPSAGGSKLKEQLERAQEFAATAAAADEPEAARQAYVARKSSTIVVDSSGEPIIYASQQAPRNAEVVNAILALDAEGVTASERCVAAVERLRRDLDEHARRRAVVASDFHSVFFWPPEPPTDLEALHAELRLQFPVDDLRHFDASHERVAELLPSAAHALDELVAPMRPSKLDDAARLVREACDLLLRDGSPTDDVVLRHRTLAHTDVFCVLNAALAKKAGALEALRADLAECARLKRDAAAVEDMPTVESCAFRELALQEDIIARILERLQEIFLANEDVTNFVTNFAAARDDAEQVIGSFAAAARTGMEQLSHDIDVTLAACEEKTREDAEADEQHRAYLATSDERLRGISNEQSENWERIVALLQRNVALSQAREAEAREQLARHVAECKRRAAADGHITAMEQCVEQLRRGKAGVAHAAEWVEQLRLFVDKMCSEVEAKNVEERALEIRIQEQLDHLDAYRAYKANVDDLLHSKEVRVMLCGRQARHLELQLREAGVALDPNKRKYEAELAEVEKELERARDHLASLTERAKEQSARWRPTEEQLEDAAVDFDPPDIAAERRRCEVKAQTLSVARQFVSTEQELIDKDTMGLRKLRTANQIAIEGVSARRKDRITAKDEEDAPA